MFSVPISRKEKINESSESAEVKEEFLPFQERKEKKILKAMCGTENSW